MNTVFSKYLRLYLPALIILSLLVFNIPGIAQVPEDTENLENLYTVHTPTAGILKHGQYSIDIHSFGSGGFTGGISVGLFERFMMGITYGGEQLIGYEKPVGNEFPGVIVRYRLWEESVSMPATTIGFEMQGNGKWDKDAQRYDYKAPGLFAVASKNWIAFGQNLGIHFGVNYNTIESDDQGGLNMFTGANLGINEQVSALVEYNFGLDDDVQEEGVERFGSGQGYLNAGVRFTLVRSLVLEALLVDILHNNQEYNSFGREVRLTYVETFRF